MHSHAKHTAFAATALAATTLALLAALLLAGSASGASAGKDRVPPSAPGNVHVRSATSASVDVAWEPAQDNVRVAGYYVSAATGRRATVTGTTYTVRGLACGESTALAVVAFDDARNRSPKATTTVSTAACPDTLPPTTPSGFRQTATTQDSIVLAWTPSSDDVGVVGYALYEGLMRIATTAEPTATLAGLSCGSTYALQVDAVDAAGNRSQFGSAFAQTLPCDDRQAPTTPAGLAVTSRTAASVSLAWSPSTDAVGVDGYRVTLNGTPAAEVTGPSTTVSELTCGTAYSVGVRAFDAAGNESQEAKLDASTSACPAQSPPPPPPADTTSPSAPSGLLASNVTQGGLDLTWNSSSDDVGVTGYDVYRNGTRIATVASTSSSQAGLTCGTSYAFAIVARDAAGNESQEAKLDASTSACPAQSPPPPPPADTTSPSAPSGLLASNVTQGGLDLTWNSSSDDVGVTGYDVYRNGTRIATVASTSSSQAGLTCGTSYAFAIVARDAAGNESQEAKLDASTSACPAQSPPPPPPPPPPAADTTPPTQPSNLAISSVTRTTVSLTWGASSDGTGVSGYRTYVNGSPTSTGALPGATVAALACGTAYTFEVDAYDAAGNHSTRASVTGSTSACADTQAPTAPANVVAGSRTATSIALSWSASSDNVGVTGYGLYRGGVPAGTSSSTTGIFSGLACNTNYTLAVDAYDASGNRSAKTVVMVSTTACPDTTPPSTPAGLAVSNVTETGLTLGWNASTDNVGVTGYEVFRNGTKLATTASTSASQSGLVCGTSYTFGVVARDAAGNSSTQAQITGSTAACALAPPPSATTFYVGPNGSDTTGTGAQAAPWRSLKKACDTVTSGLISVAAGTYVESATCVLKSGVSLDGAGATTTIIRPASSAVARLVLVQNTTGPQTISDLRLDGVSKTTSDYGMWVQNATGLTITRVDVIGFKGPNDHTGGGINVDGATDFVLSYSTLSNCRRRSGCVLHRQPWDRQAAARRHPPSDDHRSDRHGNQAVVGVPGEPGRGHPQPERDHAQTTLPFWSTRSVELYVDAVNCRSGTTVHGDRVAASKVRELCPGWSLPLAGSITTLRDPRQKRVCDRAREHFPMSITTTSTAACTPWQTSSRVPPRPTTPSITTSSTTSTTSRDVALRRRPPEQ